MELVTEKFKASMRRVDIIRALAECVGMVEVVEVIEKRNGRIKSEGELVRLENRVFERVAELRSEDRWPPK